MRRVHSTDTTPERRVRSFLHKLGFRFRLHRKDLPGKPDIVLPGRRTVIFVHGCFWHCHRSCPRATIPASRQEYWRPKFERTIARDRENQEELRRQGWNVIVVWECETKALPGEATELALFVRGNAPLPRMRHCPEAMEPDWSMVAENHADWKETQ